MKKKILGIMCAMVLMTGCSKSPKLSNGEEVVASLDGKDFTANELYDAMKGQYGTSILIDMIDSYIAEAEITDTDAANVYADSVISQYKLQYKQYGMDFNEALASSGFASEADFKKVIIADYNKNEVLKNYLKGEVTDKEIEKYYKDEISEQLDVKHILVIPDVKDGATDDEKKAAEDAALEEAKGLIKKLDEGANFDDLAKENSDDTATAKNGGAINNVTKDGYVAEFYNAAYKLEEGKYTAEPVKSEYGYHIIYLVKKGEKESLESLKDVIINSIVDKKIKDDTDSSLKNSSWDKIRSKYKMNIVDTKIKGVYESSISNTSK